MFTKYFFKVGESDYVVDKLRQFLYSRNYLKTPTTKVSSSLFDDSMVKMVNDYKAFHKLNLKPSIFYAGNFSRLDGGLNEDFYSKVGSELTPAEIDAWAFHDIDVKRLLYGIAGIDPCGGWEIIVPVIAKEKFIGWGYTGITPNCFDYAAKQLSVIGRSMKSPNWGTKKVINPNIFQLYLTEDVAGMKKGYQPKQFTSAVIYLRKSLKAGIPVVVGVEDGVGSPNKDKVTDHFVTIVGMGKDTIGNYFTFYDNATSDTDDGTSDMNRLYCNSDKFEIKGTGPNKYIQENTGFKHYIVTQVRETK